MKKHFYSHLTRIDSIHVELDALILTQEEKKDLIVLVQKNVHHTVMDTVLSELTPADKKRFLIHIADDNHDTIWSFLKDKIKDAEEKIASAYATLEKEIHADIRAARKQKKKNR